MLNISIEMLKINRIINFRFLTTSLQILRKLHLQRVTATNVLHSIRTSQELSF